MIDFSRNHFELFGLPVRFRVDAEALDRAYRALQAQVHPDRHATGNDTERRIALQSSARVNEAYRALRDPSERAAHLLALRGVVAQDEADTQLAVEFLEKQLERREQASEAAEAHDLRALESLAAEVRAEMMERETALTQLLDGGGAMADARYAAREYKFLAKMAADIDAMIGDL